MGPSWAAGVVRDREHERQEDERTALKELVGCILSIGQEAKTEILEKVHKDRGEMRYIIAAVISTLIGTSAWCVGPVLTPDQIQAAIMKGRKYKTADKFFSSGLKGKRVQLTRSVDVMFFNDWQAVALESAGKRQLMGELTSDAVQSKGASSAEFVG